MLTIPQTRLILRNSMSIEKTCIVWHGHHDCRSPLEFLTESFESRLETINTVKAASETPDQIQLRLKLFKKVTGKLPASIIKAQAAREATREARKARKATREAAQEAAWVAEQEAEGVAREAAREAQVAAWEDILKLHSAQCGCNWTPERPNIFDYGLK